MKEKINYCPVCKKQGPFNYYEICPECGWEQDPIQNEDVKFPGGANKLSLLEYQYIYNSIKEKKKNYKWDYDSKKMNNINNMFEDNNNCACCGKDNINIGEKCSNCGWIKCYVQEQDENIDKLINNSSLLNYKEKRTI